MKYIYSTFQIIYKIYYFIFFSISLILLFPFFYYFLRKPSLFPKAFILMRFYGAILLFFAGVKLKIVGQENIPKSGTYIICPNHTSFLDTFCIYKTFSQYFVFIGKKEIEKWPLFHVFYTSGMNILVDRHSNLGLLKALKRMSQEIDSGHSLVIFPEGTVSKEAPKLAPFKSGAFAIAIQKQVPIVPITFINNWKRLQRGGIFKGKAGPGTSIMIIHKPILTKGMKKEDVLELQKQTKKIISEPLKFAGSD